MGLFKKRSTDPGELDQLRSEIAAMAARLDAADSEKAHLEQRLHHLSTVVQQPAPPPPPPPEPVISAGDLDMMRARIQRLYDRLDDPAMRPQDAAAVASLEARIDRLSEDLTAAASTPASAPSIEPAEYDALRARVDALQAKLDAPAPKPSTPPPPPPVPTPTVEPAQLDEIRARVEALHERVSTMDARITSISTELANQLTELSGEVDALSQREPEASGEPVVTEAVEELRDAQHRLANEQARYQIAFRQELADLAERLRRS